MKQQTKGFSALTKKAKIIELNVSAMANSAHIQNGRKPLSSEFKEVTRIAICV